MDVNDGQGAGKTPSKENPQMNMGAELVPAISQEEFYALAEMIGFDMPDVLVDVLDTYIEESNGLLTTIAEAVRSEQPQNMLRAVHSLKSSSASIGAMLLSTLCADLEAHLRGMGGAMNVSSQATNISTEYQRVREALEIEKARLAG